MKRRVQCRRITWHVSGTVLLSLLGLGCANHELARETARQLHNSLTGYEARVNDKMAEQEAFYRKRIERIRQERKRLIENGLEEFRRTRSAEVASAMSADPSREVRIGNLMHFLRESVAAEYDLYLHLRDQEAKADAEFQAAIEKLDRQKELIDQIKNSLSELSAKPNLRKRGKSLKDFVEKSWEELKKLDEEDAKPKASEN